MRYVFAVLTLVMLLFAALQFNDPDGPLWLVFYGIPAIWAALAWMRPRLIAGTMPLVLLGGCLVASLVLVVMLWPDAEQWWRIDVWWESETSREGMGLMIAAAVLLAVFSWSLSVRSKLPGDRHGPAGQH